eukprot:CAMPEP_0115101538 /NCGR_PEP_ID=MMETSP0227-20121206/33301_1 /TAXON_ID=89957 /ORGANISM="Polarella glacialis, Strain CCMP 1383" /LENGTH=363 /DNA_ID=CAMNT_0002497327 /DNA_START=65 /DNA_END=1156 /DNA_ORIENTATION=-
MAAPQAQDFIKGWPHPDLISTPELREGLLESFKQGLEMTHETLNYGDKENGAYMLGHPKFRQGLAKFLEGQYDAPVDWKTLMSTGGGSMGTDLAFRVHGKAGDIVVCEEPTYFLAFTMARNQNMDLLGVPIEKDGMDLVALEKHLTGPQGSKIKFVYTVPVHHNPTGYTMSNEKRVKLVKLAQQYKFLIVADEAYQLLNFEPSGVKSLFYHDDAADPRVLAVGTFSKLIGPGVKVGWVHAHESLLKPLAGIGYIDSGNNPVIFSSMNLLHFLESGKCAKHIEYVSKELGIKCKLLCKKLREVGLEVDEAKGGYFVWVKSKGKMTGKGGEPMSINKDMFADHMRLCFCWLTPAQIEEGIEYLRQ